MRSKLIHSPDGVITKDKERLAQAERERQALFDIIRGFVTTPNLDDYLTLVHKTITPVVSAENCFVMTYDEHTGLQTFEFWADKHDARPDPCPLDRGFTCHVYRSGRPLLLYNDLKRKMLESGEAVNIGTPSASWLGVPLRTPIRTIGVLVVHDYQQIDRYSESDLEFLTSVGDQVGFAIERKLSEEALRRSENRYRMFFDRSPDGILIADRKSNYVDANETICRMLGYSYDEILSFNAADLVKPEDIVKIRPAIEEVYSSKEYRRQWNLVRKNGSIASFDVIAKATPDDMMYVVLRDMAERKRAERALRKSEERYRDLVENATDILYLHDLNGKFVSVNKAAEQILGYSRDELMSMNIADCIAPEHVTKAQNMLEAKLSGEEINAYEVDILAKNGVRVAVEVDIRLVFENDKIVGVQGIARDISSRKTLEEQLRQSQKMEAIGLLAGGIAHDFNNLLTAIAGYSDLLLRGLKEGDPQRQYVEEIRDAGMRGNGLTAQLLAFSRKQKLALSVHNLNPLILRMESMLRRIVRADVAFKMSLGADLKDVEADPGQIEQVLLNLCVNAGDAMPRGGTIAISTENMYVEGVVDLDVAAGEYVKLTVSDTGEGMDEETRERIFEPFFTTKPQGKGTGLGLSTAYGIVRQSGGDIRVRSEIGRGTQFEIFLPVAASAAKTVEVKAAQLGLKKDFQTVLLVEDDVTVRNLIREILTGNGFRVVEAANGDAALRLATEEADPIDLLLTDVVLPGIGGVELRDRITEVLPGVKTLLMSGYPERSAEFENDLGGEGDFIEKPFMPENLIKKIRKLIPEISRTAAGQTKS